MHTTRPLMPSQAHQVTTSLVASTPASGSLDQAAGAAREKLGRVLAEYRAERGDDKAGPQARDDADQLVACLKGPQLDLAALDAGRRALAYGMPADAWGALRELALESGVPITRVSLPRPVNGAQLAQAIDGLNTLTELATLDVPVPQYGVALPLHRLEHTPGLHIAVDAWRAAAWNITVPAQTAAVEADGEGLLDVASARGVVRYLVDDGIEVGAPRRLAEGTWHRTATEPGFARLAGEFEGDPDPQTVANELNHNGKSDFTPQETRELGLRSSRKVCRHIVIAWNDASLGRTTGGTTTEGLQRQSYGDFLDAQALGRSITPQSERDFHALTHGQAPALVAQSRFGQALRQEFEEMETGERRNFVITTSNHAMAMDLRVKTRNLDGEPRRVCVVRFHDPNRTATHVRHVTTRPQRLETLTLARWLGPLLDLYFEGDDPQVVCLYRFERPLSPRAEAGRVVGVDEATLRSPPLMRKMLVSQHAQLAARTVEGILGSSKTPQEKAELLLARGRDGYCAVDIAMSNGAARTVQAWMEAVLAATDAQLPQQQRFQVVRAASGRGEGGHQAFSMALVMQEPDVATAYARAILNAPAQALTPAQRIELLQCGNTLENPALLQRLAETDRPSSHAGVYGLVKEITLASGLSLADKQRLVSSRVRTGLFSHDTAAETAMESGHPEVAAAMICAIRESGADARTVRSLRKAVGVSRKLALQVLQEQARQTGKPSPWIARLQKL